MFCHSAQSPLVHLFFTFLTDPIECVCVCVSMHTCVFVEWGLSVVSQQHHQMCLSAKEFGNVLLKQTREERKEKGSELFLQTPGGFCSTWGHFHTRDPEIACVCVCIHNTNYHPLSFMLIQNSLLLHGVKREIVGLGGRREMGERRSAEGCY